LFFFATGARKNDEREFGSVNPWLPFFGDQSNHFQTEALTNFLITPDRQLVICANYGNAASGFVK